MDFHTEFICTETGEVVLFLASVCPKNLPEGWAIKANEIELPGCQVDINAIKRELRTSGFPQRVAHQECIFVCGP